MSTNNRFAAGWSLAVSVVLLLSPLVGIAQDRHGGRSTMGSERNIEAQR